ncbi:retrovirus-related pol polyprotein from transposon TNT 1-94 [Tanacetum coccineum]
MDMVAVAVVVLVVDKARGKSGVLESVDRSGGSTLLEYNILVFSGYGVLDLASFMVFVIQERGFRSLPSSTETNPRKHVKSISTIVEADASSICRIGSHQYAISIGQNSTLMYETKQITIPFLSRLNGCYCESKKGSYGPQFLEAYSYGASHINKSIQRKEKDPRRPCYINNVYFDNGLPDLGDSVSVMPLSTYLNLGLGELAHTKLTVELAVRTVKYPKGIAENMLVVLDDRNAYRDEGMGDVIFGEPFLREVHINARRFEGMITIHNELTVGSQESVSFDVKLSLKTIVGNSVSMDLSILVFSGYGVLDLASFMVFVLQERGFGSLPSSTKTNLREHVNSISTIVEADASSICRIGSHQYAISIGQNSTLMYETKQITIPFLSRLNGCYCESKKGSYGPQFLEAYSYGASHINKSIQRKEKDPRRPCYINNVYFDNGLPDLGDSVSVMPLSTYLNLGLGELAHTKLTVELAVMTVKYPKGIAENMLVGIGKFVFLIVFIILDMLEDMKVPLILERPFLSTAHAKIDVFKRKITLRLRERMELDLESRLMGETLVLNRSLDPFIEDYIELNDLNVPLELRRDQVDNLMPTIEEGEVIEEYIARKLRITL